MQFREHPGVKGKRDAYPFDPRQLKIDPTYNVRDLKTKEAREKLDELKESIRANGVQVPIEVRFDGEDVYVVAGHRRYQAVMELIADGEPIETVLTIPEPKGRNDAERTLGLVISNSGEPLTRYETAEVVRRLNAYGWDKAQIAKRLGWKSTASVTQCLDLLAVRPDVQAAAKTNGIAATTLRQAVAELGPDQTLKLIKDDEAQGKRTRPRDVRKAAGKPAPAKPKASETTTQGAPQSPAVTSSEADRPPRNEAPAYPVTTHHPSTDMPPQSAMPARPVMAKIVEAFAGITKYADGIDFSERQDSDLIEITIGDLKPIIALHAELTGEHP